MSLCGARLWSLCGAMELKVSHTKGAISGTDWSDLSARKTRLGSRVSGISTQR